MNPTQKQFSLNRAASIKQMLISLFHLATFVVTLTVLSTSAYGQLTNEQIEGCLAKSGVECIPLKGSEAKKCEDAAKKAESPLKCETVATVVSNRQQIRSYFAEAQSRLKATAGVNAKTDSKLAAKANDLMNKLKTPQSENEGKLSEAVRFRSTCKATPTPSRSCVAKENLNEVAQKFIDRCCKGSILSVFPKPLLSATLREIKEGTTDTTKVDAWKLLDRDEYKK